MKRKGSQTSPASSKKQQTGPDAAADQDAGESSDWEQGWQSQQKSLQGLTKLKLRMQAASSGAADMLEAMKAPGWIKVVGWAPGLEDRIKNNTTANIFRTFQKINLEGFTYVVYFCDFILACYSCFVCFVFLF